MIGNEGLRNISRGLENNDTLEALIVADNEISS